MENIPVNELEKLVRINAYGLKELSLQGKLMSRCLDAVTKMTDLEVLNLSHNNLTGLPYNICSLYKLTVLRLAGNHFNELPKGICQLKKLIKLNVSDNSLTRIPEDVANLEELQELYLSRNRLNEVPKSIYRLKKLVKLDMSYNSLIGIPEDIADLDELKELYLSGNRLEELPRGICRLKKLIKLDVSNTSLAGIPEDVSYLEELQDLNLSSNRLDELPKGIYQLKKLIKLNVTLNSLAGIPEDVANLEELQELYLSRNGLVKLPKGICQLKKLIKLDASHNSLIEILEDVVNLEELQELCLSRNRLVELPKGIFQLNKLIKLDASYNNLTGIPEEVDNLAELQTLNLSGNRLVELPNGVWQLKKLIKVIASDNCLTRIPEDVANLEELQELDLRGNRLVELPEGICQLNKLTVLHWAYNPLRVPPVAICSKGLSYIAAYLRDIRQGRTLHQKVVLLGSSGAGKTSLAKTLVSNKPSCVQEEDRTIVMDRTTWETAADGAIMNIVITDFGGNDWYKIVHHLFLDEKALIILVVNLARYAGEIFDKEAGSWLNVLTSRVPKANFLLVGTQIDSLENEEGIRVKRAQVLQDVSCFAKKVSDQSDRFEDVITVSSKTLQGIEGLRKLLLNFVLRNGQVIPSSWSEIYSDLQNSKITGDRQFLTFDAVEDLVKTKSKERVFKRLVISLLGKKESRAETVLSFFHNVGALLWYEHSDELKRFVFHKADFLVQLMKAVFSERHSVESLTYQGSFKELFTSVSFEEAKEDLLKRGIMSCDFLRCLWSHLHLEEELFDALTKLFVHLDLCYPMNEGVYQSPLRFPWFLTQKAPETQGLQMMFHSRPRRSSHRLSLMYMYPAMCPEPLYHIFVVRLHRHVHDIKSRHDWKDGLYARIKGSQVLVHRSHQATETVISVSAEGSDLLEVWSVLLSCQETLTGVMSEWTGIRWECWIVCPHCTYTGDKDHGRFPASNLDKKCPKGRVTCDRHKEQIPACLVYPVGDDISSHQKVLEEYTSQLAKDEDSLPNNQGSEQVTSFKTESPSQEELSLVAHDVCSSWKALGKQLGSTDADLNQIEADNQGLYERCYSVLKRWTEVQAFPPTYEDLARALQSKQVERGDLAAKYCSVSRALESREASSPIMDWSYKDGKPTGDEIFSLAKDLQVGNWKQLGRGLKLEDSDLYEIDHDHTELFEKIYAMLSKWTKVKGKAATYGDLAEGLESVKRRDLIRKFCCASQMSRNRKSQGVTSEWETGV